MMKCKIFAILGAMTVLSASGQVYKDPTATPQQRAESIVAEMTLQEKVSLMQHQSPAIGRLGIKQYNWWNEALHGVGRAGRATVFPQPIGMAASFDDELLYDVFTAISDEARAKNTLAKKAGPLNIYQGLTFWTPNINIYRDPRWGRGHETYGEDPYLTSRMGLSVVRGLQGDSFEGGNFRGDKALNHYKLMACAKHYAVHSGPEWCRHSFNAKNIPARDLWETYLPAFKSLVEDGDVKQVMCAYNRYEDEPCCGSNQLLQTILRDEWGFDGVVVSDCGAIGDFYNGGCHQTEPDESHASAAAVRAGTDLECGGVYGRLVDAVGKGIIDEKEIDKSAIRVMKMRYQLGEMDDDALVAWTNIPADVIDSDAHKALADRMAHESIVLLKNDGTLPLAKDLKIGLIGPNANDSIMQWGNYNGFPSATSTLYSALSKRVPADRLTYIPGVDHTSDKVIDSFFNQTQASNGKPGFDARYWNTNDKGREPDVTCIYSNPLKFSSSGATVWAPGVPLGGFAVEFTTKFVPEESGEIAFSAQSIGWLWIEINGQGIFWGVNMKSSEACKYEVEAGKTYNIKIAYTCTETAGDALSIDFGRQKTLDIDSVVDQFADVDVVLFAGGLSPQLEGEETPIRVEGFRGGDREIIELPASQRRILAALRDAGKKVVYVNYSGSAVAITDEAAPSAAALQVWYPGQAGGEAIADVLFGDYNPSGKLPITFYTSTDELPDFLDYSMKNRTYRYYKGTPLYHFGHGLSYTDFKTGKAKVKNKKGEGAVLTVPVTNKGKMAGTETVQVYVSRPADVDGPSMQLRDFARVDLRPGETKKVEFKLDENAFLWFDPTNEEMLPLAGDYVIYYGNSSDPAQLQSVKFTYKP